MTIEDAVQTFLLDVRVRGLRPATLAQYTRNLRAFVVFCDTQGIVHLHEIDANTIRRYIVSLQVRGLRPTSIRTWGRVARVWLRFCADQGLLDASPMKSVRLPKPPKPDPDCFTNEEIHALLGAAQRARQFSERNTVIVLALLDTGCRVNEFSLLRRGDVDLTTGKIVIRSENAKTRQQRSVFVGRTTLEALRAYLATLPRELAPADPLWHGRQGPLTTDGMKRTIRKIGVAAGVHPHGPHRYRRTCATMMLHDGADAKSTAALLGHSVDELLKSYVMSNDETLRAAHAQHGPVDRLLRPKKE